MPRPTLPGWWRKFAAAAFAFAAIAAGAATTELTQAHATIQGEAGATIAEVALPYHLDRAQGTRSARATFELHFSISPPLDDLYGLYIARIGNTADVWINDTLVEQFGDVRQSNADDFSKAPRYVSIPSQLLQRDNVILIDLHGDGGRRGGLSTLVVGPDLEVRPLYEQATRWRMGTSVAISVFSLLVGTLALLLWGTQLGAGAGPAMRDNIYLCAGVAEFCWALRVGDTAIEHPPLPWPAWGVVMTAAFAGWMCCIALFCHDAAGWNRRADAAWMRRALAVLFGSSIAASTLAYTLHRPLFLTAWLGSANLLLILYTGAYLVAALRSPSRATLVIGLAGAVNVAVGVHDWLAIRISGDYSQNTWIRYSSVLFGLSLGYIVITRFRAATAQAKDLMVNLAARVSEKEQALSVSYAQLDQAGREHERAAERSRILRDMHEGVGSHLSSAIRQIETGATNPEAVLQSLRESLDHLKLSIDAINLPPGDVTALLASLRYRLEPRFAASGVKLQWQVDALDALQGFDGAAMRHLQFMIFEALSNVLQHAQASVLRIEARATALGAQLKIIDDGLGFDVRRAHRRGLLSMRERAGAIGAKLSIASRPGQTVVQIVLP
jgi:signal transduction histidine kinase